MAGVITSLPPLVEQPPGNNSSNPAGLPGVTYTAAVPVLAQTWTGLQTFTPGSMQFAGSTSGNTFLNATAIASGVLTLPAATDTLVAQNTVDTLTNKTLTNPIINGGTFTPTTFTVKDNAFTLQDDGDVTKQMQFQLSGISTATTRTLTLQDSSGTIALTGNNLGAFAATTSAQLRGVLSDETGTGLAYFQGGDLGTPSAGVLSSATGLPISTGVSGLGTSVAAFLATPSSANLRAALTDEVGTGAAYFVGGALGTPASGTATNLTGLPLSGLTVQAAYTIVANATGSSAVPTAMDVTALTSKPSPISADIVLIQDSAASNALKKTTVGALASAGAVASINGQTGALVSYFQPQGRLTLQTLTPVMNTTQSAKTTIYYSPYQGNMVPLYDGTNMIPTVVSEISVATTDTTKSPAAIGASKVNDWFVWNDSGTTRIGHGPDWTNDTTRSAGTALVMVNGILLNNASITNGPAASRGTYVGTTRSNASSQLDWIFGGSAAGGTAAWLGVWNAYNRRAVQTQVIDSTTAYSYASASVRAANASNSNRVSFVSGLAEDAIWSLYGQVVTTAATSGSTGIVGVGLDSITVTDRRGQVATPLAASTVADIKAVHSYPPQIGFHFLQALEATDGSSVLFNVNVAYGGLEAILQM